MPLNPFQTVTTTGDQPIIWLYRGHSHWNHHSPQMSFSPIFPIMLFLSSSPSSQNISYSLRIRKELCICPFLLPSKMYNHVYWPPEVWLASSHEVFLYKQVKQFGDSEWFVCGEKILLCVARLATNSWFQGLVSFKSNFINITNHNKS